MLLEGELEFTFRGEKSVVRAGSTVNIPANAPHGFKNASATDCARALHVHTRRAGGVLHRDWRRCEKPHSAPAKTQQR